MEQQKQHSTTKYDVYSLICGILGFFFPPSAIGGAIFGHLHKKHTGKSCIGTILSWITLSLYIAFFILMFGMIAIMGLANS